jgi:hypothetical protein
MDNQFHPNIPVTHYDYYWFSRFPIDHAPLALSQEIYEIQPPITARNSPRRYKRNNNSEFSKTATANLLSRYRAPEPKQDFNREGVSGRKRTPSNASRISDGYYRDTPGGSHKHRSSNAE